MTTSPEPTITINGTTLTSAQAMTVRVAIESFSQHLIDPTIQVGDIGPLYLARIEEIRESLYRKPPVYFTGPGTMGHPRDCGCAACRNFDD